MADIWNINNNFKMQAYISEMYQFNHRHDKSEENRFQYENNLLKKNTSVEQWKNPTMNFFMTGIEKLMVHLLDSVYYVRNYTTIGVKKYYTDYLD